MKVYIGGALMKPVVWIGKSPIAGYGLFAGQDIRKGTEVLQYIGLLYFTRLEMKLLSASVERQGTKRRSTLLR